MNDATDMPDLSRFDAVEIMPVYENPDEGFCEPCPDWLPILKSRQWHLSA